MQIDDTKAPARAEEILAFWFDGCGPWSAPAARMDLWFGKSDAVDDDLRRRFGADLEQAAAGAWDHWDEHPRGRMARILLFDQIPRNVFRGTPQAFAYDERALRLAREGVEKGHDRALPGIHRAFFYLPFEHAESMEAQSQAVALYQRLLDEAPPDAKELFTVYLDYAVAHLKIIERFGRFPHRNQILGRETTDEEAKFLLEPGSSF